MPEEKKYDVLTYERRLKDLMNALCADEYDFDYTRRTAWVTFSYHGHGYRFEYSVEKACEHGLALAYGSDTFCYIVQTIEDMTRSSKNGINALQQWVEGKAAPAEPKSMQN